MKLASKKIQEVLFKILNRFWERLFLILIFLLVLDLIIGAIFFFSYCFKVKEERTKFYLPLKMNQNLVSQLSLEYQKREEIFNKAKDKNYIDLFQKIEFEKVIEESEKEVD